MQRMSTRRGGERPGAKSEPADEKPPAAAAPPPAPAAEVAAPAPPQNASTSAAPQNVSAAPPPAAPPPPLAHVPPTAAPRLKRAKVEPSEEASWGEMPPAPIGIVPQPLLPIRTVAGTGVAGFADGLCATASFRGPTGIALGADGCLYVADADNRRLRKVVRKAAEEQPAERRASGRSTVEPLSFETVTTVAGSGHPGIREGRARDATLCDPNGLAIDAEGNVLISDAGSHTIRRLSTSGEVTLLAGSGKPGFADGTGQQAQFEYPYGVAFAPDGALLVADSGNHRIRTVSPQGEVRTLAGSGAPGHRDGSGNSAQFFYPVGIAVDADGTAFVADRANHRVRKVTSKGTVSTLAGSGRNAVVDGKGQAASFAWPNAITLDPSARGAVYVSDTFAFRIRRITRDGQTRTICIGPAPSSKPAAQEAPVAPAPPAATAPVEQATATSADTAAPSADAAASAAQAPAAEGEKPAQDAESASALAVEEAVVDSAGDAQPSSCEAAPMAVDTAADVAPEITEEPAASPPATEDAAIAPVEEEAPAESPLAEVPAAAPEEEPSTTPVSAVSKEEEVLASNAHASMITTSAAAPSAADGAEAVPANNTQGAEAEATAPPLPDAALATGSGAAATQPPPARPPVAPAAALTPAASAAEPDTDPNRANTLLFIALDAERSLLFVSEQSNHRVRCVTLHGPTVMTS